MLRKIIVKDRTFNLRELCREADVTERTVRYYIKEGLLPPPNGSGPFSRYTYEHWLRLQFIKRLKDEYLPLSEIKNLLDSRSLPELEQLARQAQLIPSSGPTPKGYEIAPAGPSDPLLSLLRSESGAAPARKMLREQMAPVSWPAPQAEMASFASLPEAVSEDQPEIEPEVFSIQVSGTTPPPPPVYSPPGQAGPVFQAHSLMAAPAPVPAPVPPAAPPGMAAGGAMPRPSSQPAAAASPMRAMKFRASSFAANEGSPPFDEATISARQAAAPEPPVMPLMAMASAPAPLPAQESAAEPEQVTGQTWERIEVAPGVELHIEKRIAEAHRPALAALLQAARRFFGQKEI